MNIEKMREEFEAWAITNAWLGLVGDDLEFYEGGYVFPEVQSAWLAWQASRAAIEVELPSIEPSPTPRLSFHLGAYKTECRQAIESLGLKVKP